MSDKLLTSINSSDLRLLDEAQLPQLAQELRNFIIDVVSVKEGHLGASLALSNSPLHCTMYLTPQMIY
jgi:1-deoxy-D-xylulose-5-phosphate synthase